MSQNDDLYDDDAMESQFVKPSETANLKILPPYLFMIFFGIAILMEFFFGIEAGFRWQVQIILGFLLCGIGVLIFAWAVQIFLNSNTPLSPDAPSLELITEGPYRFSRNPIYLSYLLFYLGMVIFLDLLWGVVLTIPLYFCVLKYAIEPEEKYLGRVFKGDYSAYKNRVRRWI